MIIAGIDWSMNSPSVAILDEDDFSFEKTEIHFIGQTKKQVGQIHKTVLNMTGHKPHDWACDEERWFKNALWAAEIIKNKKVDKVYLEGYSFGSVGHAHSTAENCGVLKQFLWTLKIPIVAVPPTTNKKFWSGKGNADKNIMYDAYLSRGFLDFRQFLYTKTCNSPVNDIVDSYSLALYGAVEEKLIVDTHPQYGRKTIPGVKISTTSKTKGVLPIIPDSLL